MKIPTAKLPEWEMVADDCDRLLCAVFVPRQEGGEP